MFLFRDASFHRFHLMFTLTSLLVMCHPFSSAGEVRVNSKQLLSDGFEAQTRSDYKKAFLCFKRACESGNEDACIAAMGKGLYDKMSEYNYYDLSGFRSWMNGNYSEAVKVYSLAIKLDPNKLSAYRGRQINYLQIKQYKKALDEADLVMKFDPLCSYFFRARALWHQGDKKTSVSELNRFCKLTGDLDFCSNLDDSKLDEKFNLDYKSGI